MGHFMKGNLNHPIEFKCINATGLAIGQTLEITWAKVDVGSLGRTEDARRGGLVPVKVAAAGVSDDASFPWGTG